MRFSSFLITLLVTVPVRVSLGLQVRSFPTGVPGSGYGCDNECNRGDVNYVIRASLENYTIRGTSRAGFVSDPANVDVTTLTRTFTGVAENSSSFCFDDNGANGPLGPCLQVLPNQTMYLKVINEMDHGMVRKQ